MGGISSLAGALIIDNPSKTCYAIAVIAGNLVNGRALGVLGSTRWCAVRVRPHLSCENSINMLKNIQGLWRV